VKKKSLLIVALIIVMAVASLMVACGSGESTAPESEQQINAAVQEGTSETTDNLTESEIADEAESENKGTEPVTSVTEPSTKAADSEVKSSTTATTAADSEVKSSTAATAVVEPSKKATGTETTSGTIADKRKETETPTKEEMKESTKDVAKESTAVTQTTEAKKVCYITVDGYCSSKQIQLKGGESVYEILKKSGASVSARNTGYGLYIEGINGRFEFDEGPTSGWVYTVNGTRPNTSCSNYEVKSGDKIVWTYVTEV